MTPSIVSKVSTEKSDRSVVKKKYPGNIRAVRTKNAPFFPVVTELYRREGFDIDSVLNLLCDIFFPPRDTEKTAIVLLASLIFVRSDVFYCFHVGLVY